MFNRLRAFLWARWEHLRQDRTFQLFLLLSLITLIPALYYGRLFHRAVFLLLLAWCLVMIRFYQQDLGGVVRRVREAQLTDPRPPHLIFFYLQLRNPFVSGVVFRIRLFLAVNVCLLLLGNPLWLPVVDVFLGFCFWLLLAVSDELYLLRRDGPSAAPVGGSSGAGLRTAAEQAVNHVQRNPKLYTFLLGVGAALGYVGKSVTDGMVEVRVQKTVIDYQSQSRLEEAQALSRLELDKESQRFKLKEDHLRNKLQLKLDFDSKLTDNKIRLIRAQPPLRGPSSMDQPDLGLGGRPFIRNYFFLTQL